MTIKGMHYLTSFPPAGSMFLTYPFTIFSLDLLGMATNEASPETLGNDAKDENSQGYASNSPPDANEAEGAEESELTRRALSRDISTSNHAAPLGDLGR